MTRFPSIFSFCPAILLGASIFAQEPSTANALNRDQPSLEQFLLEHCLECHQGPKASAGLTLNADDLKSVEQSATWEKVLRRLRARQMPPMEMPRPTESSYHEIIREVEDVLDRAAELTPRPGRTDTLRRMNRSEYQNAIRDLLALEVDTQSLLPPDESSHGFDNVTVGDLSPTLLSRYISAAQKISQLAVGTVGRSPGGDTFRVRADLTQETQVAGLPLGTRGGILIPYIFPQDGDYEIQVRLARDRNEEVEGLKEPHDVEVLLDRERHELFRVAPPQGRGAHADVDAHLKVRITVTAGPHQLGVTFLKKPTSLLETKRQPFQAHFNMHRHPRINPAIFQVSITGPHTSQGTRETPSRERLFVRRPHHLQEEPACAREILGDLMRRAYRRPVNEADFAKPLEFYDLARKSGDFDSGIEMAVSSILVNPYFLFRIESDPAGLPPKTAYRISDVELASRLSFFLWSSIPDDELFALAMDGKLSDSRVLAEQVRRMLADPRAHSMVKNFAGQWLYLRNLESMTPDLRLFPDFDDNLRQAFRQETELFFTSVMQEDQSVLRLLKASYTFLNERLAKHYGIPHIYGTGFRRVELEPGSQRGGLFRHGSILTVTSYATRTSPVIRGHWILKNILGVPPPPPPADVPALEDNTVSSELPMRERLAAHRANAACAGCHNLMDPVGFALENFDAVGRWRDVEAGRPIDVSGGLPDGSQFDGAAGLERQLLARPELFVGTIAEKLLTFALGRGIESTDGPAIRKIVHEAESQDFRFSSLVIGIVSSVPFQMRSTL